MKKIFFGLLLTIIGCASVTSSLAANINQLMAGVWAATRPVAFRQKDTPHRRGYEVTVGMTVYQGNFKVLVTAWGGLPEPTPEEWPEVFVTIEWYKTFLREARAHSKEYEEWDVYVTSNGEVLYRGFISPNKTVVYRTTEKHNIKGYRYSAMVVWYCNGWRKLVTSYDGRPWVTTAEWPALPQVLANMHLPPPGTPPGEDPWRPYKNQFVGLR